MLDGVLAGIVTAVFEVSLLVALASTIAASVIWLFRLQVWFYRRALSKSFRADREKHYLDRGLLLQQSLLHNSLGHLVEHEAVELLSNGTALRQRDLPRWTLNLIPRLEASFANAEVLTDKTADERAKIRAAVLSLARITELRYELVRLLLCCVVGVALSFALHYNLLDTLAGKTPTLFSALERRDLGSLIAQFLTGMACGVLTSLAIALRSEPRLGKDEPPPPRNAEPAPSATARDAGAEFKVGQGGAPIRAINFSSGAFDTVMQLGVIHALTVIQAKAPDAVVGLSVGAVNAAALAEVIQAGAESEKEMLETARQEMLKAAKPAQPSEDLFGQVDPSLQRDIQKVRLIARAKRLRGFIEAAHVAPERLFKALLPDAYQIDSLRPLAPLRQPRYAIDERRLRTDFVSNRTGLARLYNRFLDIPISIGTATMVVRRILGIKAAGDIPKSTHAWGLRLSEFVHIWVLLATHFFQAAALVPSVWRAYFPGRRSQTPATAARLIFRSRHLVPAWKLCRQIITAAAIAFCWYCISIWFVTLWTPVSFFIGLAYKAKLDRRDDALLQNLVVDLAQGRIKLVALMFAMTTLAWALLVACDRDVWRSFGLLGIVSAALTLGLASIFVATMRNPDRFSTRLIAPYGLSESLFRQHGVRTFFVDLFNRSFYENPTMDQAVEAALLRAEESLAPGNAHKKPVSYYWHEDRIAKERILLGLSVANTEDKGLDLVPGETPLITGLEAATALTPYLPPVELQKKIDGECRTVLHIDGSKVSHEATHSLLQLIREHRDPQHGPLYIYSVSRFPSTMAQFEVCAPGGEKKPEYLNLVDIARRALSLQRFRDAKLERRLTTLISRAIPPGKNEEEVFRTAEDEKKHNPSVVLRAWFAPIELEFDTGINRRILRTEQSERRRLIAETIADGCRAALQVMIPKSIGTGKPVSCAHAVQLHLAGRDIKQPLKDLRLSGETNSSGPGLAEICAHCSLNRAKPSPDESMMLRPGKWVDPTPDWPHEREKPEVDAPVTERFTAGRAEKEAINKKWEDYGSKKGNKYPWPRQLVDPPGPNAENPPPLKAENDRPTVSLLFSGGVFRGVFQLGVLNGLSVIGLRPDLVAGASVGTITAAMAARAFSRASKNDPALPANVARMAATFLTIDRLILTDRFADFVRNLTVRAADTRFSIRDADHVFRKYDYPGSRQFEDKFRRVVAGIERLFYVAPYRLNEMTRALRTGKTDVFFRQAERQVQHFLDRMQVGEEALGAEALELLIERHVTTGKAAFGHEMLTIDTLREQHGVQFLATTTNLDRGRLEVLGELPGADQNPAPLLVQTLLASSAFPGVFRPRWAWELSAHELATERYVDGGVMDNLPMDAIAQFLERAADQKKIPWRPRVPHLIVAGSLEVKAHPYRLTFTRERLRKSWQRLSERAKQLSYNTKLDAYEDAENTIRALLKKWEQRDGEDGPQSLLEIDLLSIKPNWLCGTFAVHPMLGFKRENQIKSIAHGCACTIRKFACLKKDRADWLKAWGIEQTAIDKLPDDKSWSDAFEEFATSARSRQFPKKGIPTTDKCWLNERITCPFSHAALSKLQPSLETVVVDGVSRIHKLCAERETHLKKV